MNGLSRYTSSGGSDTILPGGFSAIDDLKAWTPERLDQGLQAAIQAEKSPTVDHSRILDPCGKDEQAGHAGSGQGRSWERACADGC